MEKITVICPCCNIMLHQTIRQIVEVQILQRDVLIAKNILLLLLRMVLLRQLLKEAFKS